MPDLRNWGAPRGALTASSLAPKLLTVTKNVCHPERSVGICITYLPMAHGPDERVRREPEMQIPTVAYAPSG
jgi:hypothetical protein